MKQVAPAPPPACFNWAGFYGGIQGGYKFSSVDTDLSLGETWNLIPDDRDFVIDNAPDNLDNDGGALGGLIGYNFQWKCWVLGVEGSGEYLWARESDTTGFIQFSTFFPIKVTTSFETHYLATFGPRVGYAFGNWLPYVTGGLAIGDLEYKQRLVNPPAFDPVYDQHGSVDDTNVGWMVGGGLQYALTAHWSVRAQYQYIDLGNVDFDTLAPDQNGFLYSGHHEAELHEHQASVAIIYKF